MDIPEDCPKTRAYEKECFPWRQHVEIDGVVQPYMGNHAAHSVATKADAMRDELLPYKERAEKAEAALAVVRKDYADVLSDYTELRESHNAEAAKYNQKWQQAEAALAEEKELVATLATMHNVSHKRALDAEAALAQARAEVERLLAEEAHHMGALGNMVPNGIVTGTVKPLEEAQSS